MYSPHPRHKGEDDGGESGTSAKWHRSEPRSASPNDSAHARKFAVVLKEQVGRGTSGASGKMSKVTRDVPRFGVFCRASQVLLRFSCHEKPPMPRPGLLSARPFNRWGMPWTRDGKAVRRCDPPRWDMPGTPGSFANRRRTAFHAAPGISRAFRQTVRAPAPPRRQRKPVYPMAGQEKYGTGAKGGDERG